MDTDTAGNPIHRPSAYCSWCCGPTNTGGQEWTKRERYTALREENARLEGLILDFIEKHDCESVPEPGCRCGSCRIIDPDCPCKPFAVEARRIHAALAAAKGE